MASTLTDRLSRVVKTMRGQARITESNVQEMLREVRMALLEADVALPVVRDFIARVKDKALGADVVGSLTPGQALVGIVNRELAATMGEGVVDINLAAQPPAVILMAGLQGAGKTTTTAKLAKHLIERRRKKVLTVSTDVYRPAAIEQLRVDRDLGPFIGPVVASGAVRLFATYRRTYQPPGCDPGSGDTCTLSPRSGQVRRWPGGTVVYAGNHEQIGEREPDEVTVDAELWWDGTVRATGTATWKRWRPRS